MENHLSEKTSKWDDNLEVTAKHTDSIKLGTPLKIGTSQLKMSKTTCPFPERKVTHTHKLNIKVATSTSENAGFGTAQND